MTPADRKNAFRRLCTGRRLSEVARLLNAPVSTVETWYRPAHPRAPSEDVLKRLRKAVLQELTEQIRGLGHEVIPRQRTAA